MSTKTNDLMAQLIAGGMEPGPAETAAKILAPEPKVTAMTQAMIDRANARVRPGTGWAAPDAA